MGGRALKNTKTRRYKREEYDSLESKLLKKFNQDFDKADTPRFYHNKKSFGDMDILVSMDGFNKDIREYIETEFSPNEIFHNGNCWSFDHNELQIDLITTSRDNFDAYLNYLSFNDLGNFVGRIAQKLGLKFGQEGLWYNHNFKGQKVEKIIISKDLEKIYAFLGLDYSKWVEGFDELQDIFEFVSTSPYFDADSFQLKNLNHLNRERNSKRKSYMKFLKWIEENASEREYKFEKDTSKYLKHVEDYFPESNLKKNIRRIDYEQSRILYIKSKFNGGYIMEKYGLKGKEIGRALQKFKNSFKTKKEFEDFIIKHNERDIYNMFERICIEEHSIK